MKIVTHSLSTASLIFLLGCVTGCLCAPAKEYLTPKEIEKIQDAQEIEPRIKIYLEAAALRLQAAEDRLNGKESAPGDPLEFFTVQDMLEGYCEIMKSVMMNLDQAYQKPRSGERENLGKALKNLKDSSERAQKNLAILKRMAEDKKDEETWNLVNKAIDITGGALEGARLGLSRQPAGPEKKKRRN